MDGPPVRRICNVFLASPGDLQDERVAIKAAVEKINIYFGRTINWHIELLGWEDTLPGYGARPQELINRDLDLCDLLVGLLWRRWGTPSGQFSSGFEEEFERARGRYQREAKPEIWLFFKQVDLALIEDAGEQLTKVLAFRRARETARDTLYKEFSDKEDLKSKFEEYLHRHVLSLALPQLRQVETATETTPPMQPVGMPPARPEEAQPPVWSGEISALLGHVRGAVERDNIPEGINTFEVVRLYIFSAYLMSTMTGEVLGPHEINAAYSQDFLAAEHYRLSPAEREALFRTIIEGGYRNKPGWYWFRNFGIDRVSELLRWHASRDRSPDVRESALELAASARINLNDHENFPDLYEVLLADGVSKVRKAFVAYLGVMGAEADLPTVERGLLDTDSDVQDQAYSAKLQILSRFDPGRVLDVIMQGSGKSWIPVLESLDVRVQQLDPALLERLLEHPDEAVRTYTARALASRGELSIERARGLLKDTSWTVKELSIRELNRQQAIADPREIREVLKEAWLVDVDSILLDLFLRLPQEAVQTAVDWYSVDGPIAYKALGLRAPAEAVERTRNDLREQFEALRRSSLQKLLGEAPTESARRLVEQLVKYDSIILSNFISSALPVLAANGDTQDAGIVRGYLLNTDRSIQLEALRAIRVIGDQTDAAILLDLIRENQPEVRRAAAEAGVHLAADSREVVSALFDSSATEVLELAVRSLLERRPEYAGEVVEPVLSDLDVTKRRAAIRVLVGLYEPERIEAVLRAYLTRETYYYNVVCWFDRCLYSPEPLRELYVTQLQSGLT